MNKKILYVFMLFLTIGLYAQKKIVIKVASVAPPRSPWDIEQKEMAQRWLKITNNQVVLKFYDVGSLGGEGAVIKKMKALRPGQKSPLDGAIFTNIGMYELSPKSHALTLCAPLMFKNQDELSYVLDKVNPDIEQAVNDVGFELLGWFNVGWANFFTKFEARMPEDIKLNKLGFSGINSPGLFAAFKAAGFNMEDVPGEKTLQSIKSSNGIRVVYSIPMYAYATRYYTGLPYVLDLDINPIMSAFVLSTSVWDSIPKKYHAELLESVKAAESKFISVQQNADREYLQKMASEGVTIVSLNQAELEQWHTVFDADVEKMGSIPNSVIDVDFYKKTQAYLTEYRKTHGQ